MDYSYNMSGRKFTVETGKFAKQANGSVLVRYGETVLLVTATASREPREGIDFFPLTVDYEERMYSVGKIPGGFIKREGRPTEKAILAARLTDRPLRPLFPKGFRNAVHIVSTVMSMDQDNPPEIASINGASLALSISDIPFAGPVAAVMIGYVDGKLVVNPDMEQRENSDLHLTVAGTRDAIMMVESGANEIDKEIIIDALLLAHEEIKSLVAFQEEIVKEIGKEKMVVQSNPVPAEMEEEVRDFAAASINEALTISEKLAREARIDEILADWLAKFEEAPESAGHAKEAFNNLLKKLVRSRILDHDLRPDGRKHNEIRPITCEVGLLPRIHGSALFTRGQTQVMNACTLGVPGDVQILDGLTLEESKRFMHHYNFPPYSVGEPGFMRGPGRREIGHGALAERALMRMIPPEEEFPYTIRVVSEVLESNGSSSMGSVCSASMALMDAGVPVRAAVGGIAMGLIKEEARYAILTDIQGMEDFLGDMDFKVAGTRNGITALQMDIKVHGLNREILSAALDQAVAGYNFILDKMEAAIPSPRADLSPYAPRIVVLKIAVDKIREVIGPGGKMVNKIIDETGVKIDIEDDGTIYIASPDGEAAAQAKKIIEDLVREVEVGEIYMGTVVRVESYGAFVELLPGKDGLVHISQLDRKRVAKTEDVVKVGDSIEVKVIGIDEKGRVKLSHKVLLPPDPDEEENSEEEKKRRRPR
jgi:polyribonucleotide nucleotidyltransferase